MFGELVCGPPGSGKTTYCEGKRQFLSVYDPTRPVVLLNLDPANENVFPYPCDVDVRELVSHARVMADERLGPNGSYVFCASVLERNMDWILTRVMAAMERRIHDVTNAPSSSPSIPRAPYLIIDCPGQVEFYLNASVMHSLFRALQKRLCCTLCTVHLVDAALSTRDVASYVSSCLLGISTMIDHELPHVNVMTKWDTIPTHAAEEAEAFLSASQFMGEAFDRVWRQQLRRRRRERRMAQSHPTGNETPDVDPNWHVMDEAEVEAIDLQRDGGRLYAFTRAMMEVVDGYGIMGFIPLNVQSQDMMLHLTQVIDDAIGNVT